MSSVSYDRCDAVEPFLDHAYHSVMRRRILDAVVCIILMLAIHKKTLIASITRMTIDWRMDPCDFAQG